MPADPYKAFSLIEKAANAGVAGAQKLVAALLQRGQGVERDYERADHYIQLAKAQGESVDQMISDMQQMRADDRWLDCCPKF